MKKTIFVLAIIAALAIALYKWLTNGENEEQKQETTEEVKEPATSEKENVNGKAEEATTEDKVNETINK
jgi:tRNA C32,U32 (ribose-2'-O)-methylase TrmJ